MKPPAIVAPEITEAEIVNRWDAATGREQRAEKTLAESRLEKGRILVTARKMYPARGPKAKGWGDLLRRLRIDEDTALRYMRLAGHVDEEISRNVREISDPLPTYAEAGIVKKPALVEVDEDYDDEQDITDDVEPENYRTAFVLRADQSIKFATDCGSLSRNIKITNELRTWVRRAADAWASLANTLEKH